MKNVGTMELKYFDRNESPKLVFDFFENTTSRMNDENPEKRGFGNIFRILTFRFERASSAVWYGISGVSNDLLIFH